MHKRLALGVLIAAVVLGHSAPAFALSDGKLPPPPPPPPTHKQGGGSFTVDRKWGYGDPGSKQTGGGSNAINCTAKDGHYGKVTAKPYTGTDIPYPTPTTPGQWYQTFCGGHAGWVWWRGNGGPPAANLQALLNQLAPIPPDVHISPTGDQIVNMTSFVWVDPVAVSVPAVAPDGSAITITATPGDVVWDFGDGTPLLWCHSSAANAYDPAKPDAAQTACSHTYARSSAGAGPTNQFTLTAHVEWTGSWAGTGGAAGGGSLGTLETTSSVPLTVAEIQALNTNH
jgi:hypothetical protein